MSTPHILQLIIPAEAISLGLVLIGLSLDRQWMTAAGAALAATGALSLLLHVIAKKCLHRKRMQKWRYRETHRFGTPREKGVGPFPTAATIDTWTDGVSLVSCLGCSASLRAMAFGFETLNEAERVLATVVRFQGDVYNGGLSSWLDGAWPHELGQIVWACEKVGAHAAAKVVGDAIRDFPPAYSFANFEAWEEHLANLPDEKKDALESFNGTFEKIEPELMRCADRYAREHWREVRPPTVGRRARSDPQSPH